MPKQKSPQGRRKQPSGLSIEPALKAKAQAQAKRMRLSYSAFICMAVKNELALAKRGLSPLRPMG